MVFDTLTQRPGRLRRGQQGAVEYVLIQVNELDANRSNNTQDRGSQDDPCLPETLQAFDSAVSPFEQISRLQHRDDSSHWICPHPTNFACPCTPATYAEGVLSLSINRGAPVERSTPSVHRTNHSLPPGQMTSGGDAASAHFRLRKIWCLLILQTNTKT